MQKPRNCFSHHTLFSIICYLLSVICFSCRTVPVMPPGITETIPLEPDGLAYFLIDTNNAGPIFEHIHIAGLNQKRFKQITERTIFAAAAVFPAESDMRFQFVAKGRYPASWIKTSLRFNRGWKRFRSPVSKMAFWHSSATGFSIAVDSERILISASVNNSVIDPYTARGVFVPEDFGEFQQGAVVSGWHNNPGAVINVMLREADIPPEMQMPVDRLFISLFPSPGQPESDGETLFEARLRLQAPDASRAGALAALFRIARGISNYVTATDHIAENAEVPAFNPALLAAVLFANMPERDGNNVNINSGILTGSDISLLINLFSVN